MKLDVVIFGGGAAGLWLLDELSRRQFRVLLLETASLGAGQTVASQGIIHGGLKYTLSGLLTRSAENISEMPLLWRECLAGEREPNLKETTIRAEFCYLWRTESISSRLGMIGAQFGLKVAPKSLSADDRPSILAKCPGTVATLDEQVISPASFLACLAKRSSDRILAIDNKPEFTCTSPGVVNSIRIRPPQAAGDENGSLELEPEHVVFAAGLGNAALREQVGLPAGAMQQRPLHMVLVRGELPQLNGHCVDGAKTRATITSDQDSAGQTVWQIGGQISEDGVKMSAEELISHARAELKEVLPGCQFANAEWGTYTAIRAEGKTASGMRPESYQVLEDGNCLTAWPTKLVLAPVLASDIRNRITPKSSEPLQIPEYWPRPEVAQPPWERCKNWQSESQRRMTG